MKLFQSFTDKSFCLYGRLLMRASVFVAVGERLVENFCKTFAQVVKGIHSRAAIDRLFCSLQLEVGRMVL